MEYLLLATRCSLLVTGSWILNPESWLPNPAAQKRIRIYLHANPTFSFLIFKMALYFKIFKRLKFNG